MLGGVVHFVLIGDDLGVLGVGSFLEDVSPFNTTGLDCCIDECLDLGLRLRFLRGSFASVSSKVSKLLANCFGQTCLGALVGGLTVSMCLVYSLENSSTFRSVRPLGIELAVDLLAVQESSLSESVVSSGLVLAGLAFAGGSCLLGGL